MVTFRFAHATSLGEDDGRSRAAAANSAAKRAVTARNDVIPGGLLHRAQAGQMALDDTRRHSRRPTFNPLVQGSSPWGAPARIVSRRRGTGGYRYRRIID